MSCSRCQLQALQVQHTCTHLLLVLDDAAVLLLGLLKARSSVILGLLAELLLIA